MKCDILIWQNYRTSVAFGYRDNIKLFSIIYYQKGKYKLSSILPLKDKYVNNIEEGRKEAQNMLETFVDFLKGI